jgi:hypothetical protein
MLRSHRTVKRTSFTTSIMRIIYLKSKHKTLQITSLIIYSMTRRTNSQICSVEVAHESRYLSRDFFLRSTRLTSYRVLTWQIITVQGKMKLISIKWRCSLRMKIRGGVTFHRSKNKSNTTRAMRSINLKRNHHNKAMNFKRRRKKLTRPRRASYWLICWYSPQYLD